MGALLPVLNALLPSIIDHLFKVLKEEGAKVEDYYQGQFSGPVSVARDEINFRPLEAGSKLFSKCVNERKLRNYDEARKCGELAVKVFAQGALNKLESAARIELGLTYDDTDEFQKANEAFIQAINKAAGDVTLKTISYSNLARIHTRQQNFDLVIKYSKLGLELLNGVPVAESNIKAKLLLYLAQALAFKHAHY